MSKRDLFQKQEVGKILEKSINVKHPINKKIEKKYDYFSGCRKSVYIKAFTSFKSIYDENSCKLGWKGNVPDLIKPYNKKHLSER